MWFAMTHRCLPTILQDLPCWYVWRLLHIKRHPQKGFPLHITFISFYPRNQLPCDPSFQSCGIIQQSGFSLYYCFCCPRNQLLCGHIFNNYCTRHWTICSCFAFFLQFLVLKLSLLDLFCFLILPKSVFQNQRIYFLRFLYGIFDIFKLQDILTGLYSSGRTSNTCAFISS